MMAQKKGGIRAEAALARFFHPKAPLEAKYGKMYKKRLASVMIIGKTTIKLSGSFGCVVSAGFLTLMITPNY